MYKKTTEHLKITDCSQEHGVNLGAVLSRVRSWTSMILVSPFQFKIFYDSIF